MSKHTSIIEQLLRYLAAICEQTQLQHHQNVLSLCHDLRISATNSSKDGEGSIAAAGKALSSVLSFSERSLLVDNALGVLGFGAPSVNQILSALLVETLSSLLLSSIACGIEFTKDIRKVSRSMNLGRCSSFYALVEGGAHSSDASSMEVIFGSRVSRQSLQRIGEICEAVIASTTVDDANMLQLIHAALKVASVSSSFKLRIPACCSLFISEPILGGCMRSKLPSIGIHRLIGSLFSSKNMKEGPFTPFIRSNLWRLFPHLLKEDLSLVVQEAFLRPLLSLRQEFHQRVEWRTIIFGLAVLPEVFREARRVLHTWFLHVGLVRLWDVRTQLVSAVLDVLDRPSVWGVEEGVINLPPVRALYCRHPGRLIRALSKSPTFDGLVEIVDMLKSLANGGLKGEMYSNRSFDDAKDGSSTPMVEKSYIVGNSSTAGEKLKCGNLFLSTIGHESIWALLIDFLPWMHWSVNILLQGHGFADTNSKGCPGHKSVNVGLSREHTELGYFSPSLRLTAASYIALVAFPFGRRLKTPRSLFLAGFTSEWSYLCDCIEDKVLSEMGDEHKA